jgi:hypothetical protein
MRGLRCDCVWKRAYRGLMPPAVPIDNQPKRRQARERALEPKEGAVLPPAMGDLSGRRRRLTRGRSLVQSQHCPSRRLVQRQRIRIGGDPTGGHFSVVLIHSVPGLSTPSRSLRTNATLL